MSGSLPPRSSARRAAGIVVFLLALATLSLALPAPVAAEEGPAWRSLNAQQRNVLQPLERDWPTIDASRKQKWLEIAARYPKLPPAEQSRISARMRAWSGMSPAERGQARLNYEEARQLTPQERQARWQAYQALSPEERRRLATRTVPPKNGEVPRRGPARDTPQNKSNIVPNPAYAAPRKAIAPTVVQAQPGATTTLINRRPAPPIHQQPGLPKIAGSPGFVDKSTLLPQRGPQAAATHPSTASGTKPALAR
jgi:hypothetical protein